MPEQSAPVAAPTAVELRQLGTRLLAQLPDELYGLGYSDREIGTILRRAAATQKIAELASVLGVLVAEIGVDARHDLLLRDVVREILDG
jgi:hypothetical protein